jgi:hypothetical protein
MRGPLAGGELRELQLVELGILREFVRLCEAHGLRYYLAYGTLLGALRHGGFIPWDADLAPAAALLTGLAWLVVPFALTIVLAQVLFAADRQSVDLGVNLVSMAASIGGALLLVPHLQAAGALVAALAPATLYAGLQYAGVARWVTTPAAGGDLVRFGAATAGAVMVLWGTARAGSLASTASALSTFLASCVATGLLSVRARLGRVMTPPGCRSIMRRPCPAPGRTMPPKASCATAPPCTSAPSVPATVTSSCGGSPS